VVRANLKGVFPTYKKLKDGTRKTYWYHRETGKRLRGEPGSPEFISDFANAEQSVRDRLAHGGTFNGLIREYTLSKEFDENLSPSTKTEYRRMLTKAEVEFGDMQISALEDWRVRKDFLEWRDRVAETSGLREADYRLSAISAMITWAIKKHRLPTNHLRGFERLYQSDRSDIIWLPDHIEAFMKVAPAELQRALVLALHTGQREGDLLKLPWLAYNGRTISLRQGKSRRGKKKRGRKIVIPCSNDLRRMLDGTVSISPFILTTKTGRRFSKRHFSKEWNRAMVKAGLESVAFPDMDEPVKLHFHDLRGTTVTMLAEAGCTLPEIVAITGHSLRRAQDILEKYLARTNKLGESAIKKLENALKTKSANRPANRRRKTAFK